MSDRRARVAEAMRIELADLIAREVKDPRVRDGLVTVSHVEVNRDLSVAQVGVSIVAGEPRAVMAGLTRAAAFLRGPLARRLQLRVAPELRFHHDTSQEMGMRVAEIVRQDEARRAEAGPGPDEEPPPGPEPDEEPPPGPEPRPDAEGSDG